MSDSTTTKVAQLDMRELFRGISEGFNLEELKQVSFDLGIKYDNLAGDTLNGKALELIEYTRRRGILQDLVVYVQRKRPNLKLGQQAQIVTTGLVTAEQRKKHRRALRDERRDIHLVHTYRPIAERPNWFDVLIYLVKHKGADLSTVDFAEFFLGRYWNNNIFRAENLEGFIGITIRAHGPTLCTCRVVFKDKYEVYLERFLNVGKEDESA